MINQYQHSDNEINLSELWMTLVKRKLIIFFITVMTTTGAAIYAWTISPVYSGEMLIELGEVTLNSTPTNDKPMIIKPIEEADDTISVLIQSFNGADQTNKTLQFKIPEKSTNLIKATYEAINKEAIRTKLNHVADILLKRHQEKAAYYQKVNAVIRPTIINSNIIISIDPIKPKKQTIVTVGFIGGLVLGTFLAFFIEFLSISRKINRSRYEQ